MKDTIDEVVDFDTFMILVLNLLPDAVIEEDNEGQLVIYTNLSLNKDDQVVPFEFPEEEA